MDSRRKSWEEENLFTGETPTCTKCGKPMSKKYIFSNAFCENIDCTDFYGLNNEDEDDDSEALSVYNSADIYLSRGCDEDYMFGYTHEELMKASGNL